MKSRTAPHRIVVSSALIATILILHGFTQTAAAQHQPLGDEYKPIASGPGIQICEPLAPPGDTPLADFGSGCALWLQWSMGFQPQLGQTPRFELAARACVELHVLRLRLTLTQADRLYNILGVTHVAVGGISGTTSSCSLTYQLFAEPSHKPIGTPIKFSGSESDVIKQLPMAAHALLTDMGVKEQHIPENVGATPADIASLGHYDWYDIKPQSLPDQPQVDELAKKLPAAALISFLHSGRTSSLRNEGALGHLLEHAPGNFLMYGAVITSTTRVPEALAHKIDIAVGRIAAPNNAVLAYWAITRSKSLDERVAAEERLARLAPNSSTAWNSLAHGYGDQGQSERQSRIAAGLSEKEWDALNKIYARWAYAAERAVALDSDYEDAWLEVATAQTFAGDPQPADAAFWKAIALDKTDERVYAWGLEMYQQKWGGNPKTLEKVAHLASTIEFPENADMHDLATELRSAGYGADAKIMFLDSIARAKSLVRKYPDVASYHANLGYYLNDQGHANEALPELLTAIKLDPDSDVGHYQLGLIYDRQNKYPQAIEQFRACVRLTGGFDGRSSLASALVNNGQVGEAEPILRELVKQQPNVWKTNQELGWALSLKKDYVGALQFLKEAERISPDSWLTRRTLCQMYQTVGKPDLAIKEGEAAVGLAPNDYYCVSDLGDAYVLAKDNESAEKAYRKAISISTDYAPAHIKLGDVLLKMGKKEEGRAELKRALELKPDEGEATRARELLDKNP